MVHALILLGLFLLLKTNGVPVGDTPGSLPPGAIDLGYTIVQGLDNGTIEEYLGIRYASTSNTNTTGCT
jgi:hypothetical protein